MPLFYEITAPNGKKNHLFGTLHVNDEEINKLPEDVMRAFQNATTLIVESDISDDNVHRAMNDRLMHWKKQYGSLHAIWGGRTEHVAAVVRQMAPYFPWYVPQCVIRDKVKKLPPMAVSGYMTDRYRDKHAFLDKNLMRRVKKNNKPIHYLETIESQIDVAWRSAFTYPEQRECFDLMMKEYSEIKQMARVKELKKRYLDDNIGVFLNDYIKENEKHTLKHRFHQMLISDRDKNMVAKLEAHFLMGNAFVAVGARHLQGIAKAYQDKGYGVRAIPMGKRIYPVLDFYDRNENSLLQTGLLLMGAGVCMTAGLTIGLEILSLGLLILGTVLVLAMMIKACGLGYAFITEPIISQSASVNAVSMFNKKRDTLLSHDVEASWAPMPS